MPRANKTKKYKLLSGGHVGYHWEQATKDNSDNTTPRVVKEKDPFTGEVTHKKLIKTNYEPGDVVESEIDLVEKFGRRKFELVTKESELREYSTSPNKKLLEKMTTSQLKEYAAEEEIDVEGLNTKKEYLEVITTAIDLQPA